MSRHVLELAGPAGAGKTTLAESLMTDHGTRLGLPSGRSEAARGLLRALPVLVRARLTARGRWWTTSELRSIGYLEAWQAAARCAEPGTVLLDHGPAYRLASLLALGPEMARTAAFRDWARRTAARWGELLDAVVWLDAEDSALRARIDDRDRAHRIRGAGPLETSRFLDRYRDAFREVLGVFEHTGTILVAIDTTDRDPAAVALEAREGLGLTRRGAS